MIGLPNINPSRPKPRVLGIAQNKVRDRRGAAFLKRDFLQR
jgi:hypothetical protein